MAKKKFPDVSQEALAANAAGEARREKETQARRKNAEKQKRFRESQKMCGFRRVTLWDAPSPAGERLSGAGFRQVPAWEMPEKHTDKKSRDAKIPIAVRIRESSLHVGARSAKVQEALINAKGTMAAALGDTPEERAVFADYLELIALLGDPGGEE